MGLLGQTIEKPDANNEQVVDEKIEKTETVVDEKTEEVVEKTELTENKTEEVTEKVEEEKKVEEESFSFESFNKRFDKTFEKEEEVKAIFEKADNYEQVQSELTNKSQRVTDLEKLTGKLNPMAWFASKDEFVRQQFLREKSGELNETQISALVSLSPDRIKEMSPENALRADLVVNKGLTGEEANAYIEKHFEDYQNDTGMTADLKVQSLDAKDRLSKLYDGIEVPEAVDYDASRQQLQDSWDTPLKEIVKGIDKVTIAEGLEFVVTDEMKQGVEQEVMNELLSGQIKPSEEAGAEIAGKIRSRLLESNMDKVVKSITADLEEQYKAKYRDEIKNEKPINNDSRTTESTVSNKDKLLRNM